MKTIDELWYGNVSPFEQCTRDDKTAQGIAEAGSQESRGIGRYTHEETEGNA